MLPPGIDEGGFVAAFVGATRSVLARLNMVAGAERLRVRVALHQGITQLDESGFGGRAVRKVAALRDCSALRAELRGYPAADLALAVSAELFDDVVEHDYPDLRGRDFRRARVRLPAGERVDAWLLTVGAPVPVLVSVGAGGRGSGPGARPAAASAGQAPRLSLVAARSGQAAPASRHAR
ncbi:hypothetical protein [Frankia sp. AgB32]|uniref:hypothetical protein n=1 Tax=Frankia sp. AgB32 TaxID=631119 RepID=UPI00200BB9DF|nr:hypothetical protein [Frankia sp. AgB32]MCK9897023.1 hypothetical protein [Frankia sp. AgB32]